MTSNVLPVSYIEPCFLLSSPRFDFPSRCFSIPHILSTTVISISLSLHLVLLAPVNSCSLQIILYYVFCPCIRVAVCLPMFFPNKTNINTYPKLGKRSCTVTAVWCQISKLFTLPHPTLGLAYGLALFLM